MIDQESLEKRAEEILNQCEHVDYDFPSSKKIALEFIFEVLKETAEKVEREAILKCADIAHEKTVLFFTHEQTENMESTLKIREFQRKEIKEKILKLLDLKQGE